jgi:PEP-CTERM motif-containing protein
MRRVVVMVGAIVIILQLVATPARAASVTYEYTGQLFNFCGFGCPEHAPADPRGADYITATLTFGNPLAPNLTFASDVLSLLTGWTMTDAFGSFYFSSTNGATLGDPSFPFALATNGSGNIVGWQIFGRNSLSEAAIINPPFFCGPPDCENDNPFYASDSVAINLFAGNDALEWDSGVAGESPEGLGGTWQQVSTPVPEPATLTLSGLGLAALLRRRLRSRSRS